MCQWDLENKFFSREKKTFFELNKIGAENIHAKEGRKARWLEYLDILTFTCFSV
jgi:hypothetical protein